MDEVPGKAVVWTPEPLYEYKPIIVTIRCSNVYVRAVDIAVDG